MHTLQYNEHSSLKIFQIKYITKKNKNKVFPHHGLLTKIILYLIRIRETYKCIVLIHLQL